MAPSERAEAPAGLFLPLISRTFVSRLGRSKLWREDITMTRPRVICVIWNKANFKTRNEGQHNTLAAPERGKALYYPKASQLGAKKALHISKTAQEIQGLAAARSLKILGWLLFVLQYSI